MTFTSAEKIQVATATLKGVRKGRTFTNGLRSIAYVASSGWVADAFCMIPGINYTTGLFSKAVKEPTSYAVHFLLRMSLQYKLKKEIKVLVESSAGNRILNSAGQLLSSALPTWLVEAPIALGLASFAAKHAQTKLIDSLTMNMMDLLDPLIKDQGASVVGGMAATLTQTLLKGYVGGLVQRAAVNYLSEKFSDEEYGSLKTGIAYAAKADEYPVFLFAMTIAVMAEVGPIVIDKIFSSAEEKTKLKDELKTYIFKNSSFEEDFISELVVDMIANYIIDCNLFDLKQLRLSLSVLNAGQEVASTIQSLR